MSMRIIRVGLTLLAGLTGCSSQPQLEDHARQAVGTVRSAVHKTVPEGERGEMADYIILVMEQEVDVYYHRYHELSAELIRLNADYDSTREDFQRVFDDLNLARAESCERLIELMTDLRMTMTPEEWQSVYNGMQQVRETIETQ